MTEKTREQVVRGEQIYHLSTLVAGELSLQEVLDKLAKAAVDIVGVNACSIRLLNEETGDLSMRNTYGLSEEYRNKGEVSKDDPVIKAAFEGEAVVVDDMGVDPRVRYPEASLREGLVSQLTVAMTFRNHPVGVLRLYCPKPKHFDEDDINLARTVATQCAVAITNAKLYGEALEGAKMAEQMRLAGIIQRRMIPQEVPKHPGFDLAAVYIPCFDVGGDFYDFIPLDSRRMVVVIADVIGKGIPAAIMMSWLRGAVRAYSDTLRQALLGKDIDWDRSDPEFINTTYIKRSVDKFNRMCCEECRPGEFVTLFCAILDNQQRSITYCSCGHEPTLLIRGLNARDLDKGGLVLGVDPDTTFDVETICLEEDDCLVFYTDGLIDALNFDDELWGRAHMLEAAKQGIYCSAEHIAKNILGFRRRFVGLQRQLDDTSIVVAKVGQGQVDCGHPLDDEVT